MARDRLASNATRVALNFTFANWRPACASPEATRRGCIETLAVHEVGHVLGLAHEQNRADFAMCARGATPGAQGSNGDLPMFAVDNDSIMSYCPEGQWTGLLSAADEDGIQRLYGGWGAPVISGDYFAVRNQSGSYARFSSSVSQPLNVRSLAFSSSIQQSDNSRNLVQIRKRSGTGRVHYLDQVSLRDSRTGLYYCWIDFGSFGMGVAGSSSECFWDLARPGDVGGTEIHVDDPVTIRWPIRVQSQWRYFTSSHVRFLGSFPRTP